MKIFENKTVKGFRALLLALVCGLTTVFAPIPSSEVRAAVRSSDYTLRKGIDVSKYQGEIDWAKVKADGVEFAFVRVAYRSIYDGKIKEDPYYQQNIEGALENGIPVGLYIFSQATTEAEAVEEADTLLAYAEYYSISFPLVMDYEYGKSGSYLANSKISKEQKTANALAFLEEIEDSGFEPMLYASRNFLTKNMDGAAVSEDYKIWVANYSGAANFDGSYDFWQYTSGGSVDGISTRVDMNYWYDDGSITGAASDLTRKSDAVTEYGGIGFSAVYDYNDYISYNPDVGVAYGDDDLATLKHFLKYGMKEGRIAKKGFNVRVYRASNSDLNKDFGDNWSLYYLHYIYYGKKDHRTCV